MWLESRFRFDSRGIYACRIWLEAPRERSVSTIATVTTNLARVCTKVVPLDISASGILPSNMKGNQNNERGRARLYGVCVSEIRRRTRLSRDATAAKRWGTWDGPVRGRLGN